MFGARIRVRLPDDWTSELGRLDVWGDVYTATLHERRYTALYRFRGSRVDEAIALAEDEHYFESVEVVDRGRTGDTEHATVLTFARFPEPTPYTIMLENEYMSLDPTILRDGDEFFDLFVRDRERLVELVDRLEAVGEVGIERVVNDIETVFNPSPITWGALQELLTDRQREVISVAAELDSVTDNPLVYPDGSLLSCGNFNGQPLAEGADQVASSLTKLAEASEQRIHKLLHAEDVPAPFLADEPGLESGFMIAHYTATGLVAESRLVDGSGDHSVVVSGGQEDVHSMGTIAARNLHETIENARLVLAIELLTAVQFASLADDPPLSDELAALVEAVTGEVPVPEGDVHLHDKMEALAGLLREGFALDVVEELRPVAVSS